MNSKTLAATFAVTLLFAASAQAETIFVSNEKDNTVTVLDGDTLEIIKTIKTERRPRGIVLGPDNKELFVAAGDGDIMDVIDTSKLEVTRQLESGPDPELMAVDSKGVVYILERGGNALRTVAPDGRIRTVAGDGRRGYQDGPALSSQFGSPKHLCLDDADNVYIADDVNAAVRKYDPRTNTVSTLIGRGRGVPPLTLKNPHGVCYEQGALYVVDMGNDRILRVKLP